MIYMDGKVLDKFLMNLLFREGLDFRVFLKKIFALWSVRKNQT
jgi:hypothetical protein